MAQSFEDSPREYRFVIGIDLGTTNSAVAYVDLEQWVDSRSGIRLFHVPQLVAPGEMAPRDVLPSFLYLPGAYDLPPDSLSLPWDREKKEAVGEFAREQGALVPGRLVSSAKSWLSHAGVDRSAPILPWGSRDEPGVSPVDASASYLRHIREAWNHDIAGDREEWMLESQLVVLTVPASFDEVARELTVAAAHRAGIPRVVLLEEPLAAFYAWLSENEQSWAEQMEEGQLILVCDVGGGTSDFSLLGVRAGEAGLRFDRLAVGEHLMLGGDNMDHAVGRHVERSLQQGVGRLDARRWHQLVFQSRRAKELLIDEGQTVDHVDLSIAGTGSSVIAGTLRATVHRDDVHEIVLNGFFPRIPLQDGPAERPRTGLTEMGLPYVQDPSITRHLGAFWRRYESFVRDEMGRDPVFPDFMLFNGGVLAPRLIRDRIREVVGSWFEDRAGTDWMPEELPNRRPDLAVAFGAAYYGLVRLGEGVRVGSGSPRAYYVGVELGRHEGQTQEAVSAVCIVPRGTEEGFAVRMTDRDFLALANQPVSFELYSSSTRLGDALGDVVHLDSEEITELPPIRTVLRFGKKGAAQQLPVTLEVRLTEVGTLELWCESEQTSHRWQLQFDVRQSVEAGVHTAHIEETIDEGTIDEALRMVRLTFTGGVYVGEYPPERLRKSLEEVLEAGRNRWPMPLVRRLADAMLEVREGRHLTARHEERWLNLAGYFLRPGFGDPLDGWRMKQVWKLFFAGINAHRQVRCRAEWWTFWRRVAGGLAAGQQLQIFQEARPVLLEGKRKKTSRLFPERLASEEEVELWMAMANLERLPASIRQELGTALLRRILSDGGRPQEFWALSRFGARTTIYGPLDRVVSAPVVAGWVERLLRAKIERTDATSHALVHLAQGTGDRVRDLPEATRQAVSSWLEGVAGADRYRELLYNPDRSLEADERAWVFGDALPVGLVMQAPAEAEE